VERDLDSWLLKYTILEVEDETQLNGFVLAHDPPEGTRMEPGQSVELTVNVKKQAQNLTMPDFLSKTLDDVRQWVMENDMPMDELQYEYSSKPIRTVVKQLPIAGTPITRGISLVFTISLGPQSANGQLKEIPLEGLLEDGSEVVVILVDAEGNEKELTRGIYDPMQTSLPVLISNEYGIHNLIVYIDGILFYEESVDLGQDPTP